jgi:hypothetical protein
MTPFTAGRFDRPGPALAGGGGGVDAGAEVDHDVGAELAEGALVPVVEPGVRVTGLFGGFGQPGQVVQRGRGLVWGQRPAVQRGGAVVVRA